jgi:hypothetical protein
MRIVFPKNPNLERILEGISYTKVADDGDKVAYVGIFGFKIDVEMLGMKKREFHRLAKALVVEGGRKTVVGGVLIVEPKRQRILSVRLSEDEFMALKKVAEAEGRGLEDLFRAFAIEAVAKRRGM